MEKRLPSSYQNLIDITLGKQVPRQTSRFSEIDVNDLANANRKQTMFKELARLTADVNFLKKEMKQE